MNRGGGLADTCVVVAMIERRDPTPNPAGDGPGDTNGLLDALRDGHVVRKRSDRRAWGWLHETYYRMVDGTIYRVTFAGSPPAVRARKPMDVIWFSSEIARTLHSGRGEVSLTTVDAMDAREREYRAALAFSGLSRMERGALGGGD